MAKYVKTEQGYVDASIFAPAQFKPEGKSYLTFSSPKNFTLEVNNRTKNWDGILEYFAYDKTWTVWDGTTILSAYNNDGEYVLYLRGTGNTKITGLTNGQKHKWVLTGSEIACTGNIENLLDYGIVESGGHPTMASYCYEFMFSDCTSLTKAPALPATTLADYCYNSMFYGCTALTQAPALPAKTLKSDCYQLMFSGCTSLTKAPALPAKTLESDCYQLMFSGCTSLTKAPALPAKTLAVSCYSSMFSGCTSLTKAPALPAKTLAVSCYSSMFYGCTALTQAPALPATTLADYCYSNMFYGCRSIKLSSTQTGEYTQEYIVGYTSDYAYLMFHGTGGTFTGTPAINTTYYLSTDNMIVRDTEVATLNGYVGSMIDNSVSNPLNITGATVGQIAKITAVDESGNPTAWEAADIYDKPASGIPKSDLAQSVQTSLAKADTAISLGLTAATTGQIIKVKTVQDGKPTEWEAVDMPSGGELILEYVHDESKFPPGRPAVYPIAYDADTKIWTSDGRLDLTTIAAAGETVSKPYQINIIEPLLQLSQDFDHKKWNPIATFKLKVLSSNTFSTSDYVPPVIADDWSKYIMISNEPLSINMPSNASDKIRMVFDGQFAGATRYSLFNSTEWFDPNSRTTIANEIGYQQRRGIYNHIVCDFDLENGKIYGTTSQTFVSYDKIGSAQGVYYPIDAVAWPQIVLSRHAHVGYTAMPYKGRLRIYNRG